MNFTQSEIKTTKNLLNNRWRDQDIQVHLADIEAIQKDDTPTKYPALVWEKDDFTFVVLKIDAFIYKCFFYYLTDQRFDTGIAEYNDLYECADKLLKSQADFLLSQHINKDD